MLQGCFDRRFSLSVLPGESRPLQSYQAKAGLGLYGGDARIVTWQEAIEGAVQYRQGTDNAEILTAVGNPSPLGLSIDCLKLPS